MLDEGQISHPTTWKRETTGWQTSLRSWNELQHEGKWEFFLTDDTFGSGVCLNPWDALEQLSSYRGNQMKHQVVAWGLMSLVMVGCSASIPVRKLETGKAPDREGTLLVLPQTELLVKYNEVRTSFSPARWSEEVEACRTRLNISPDSSRSYGAFPAAALSCRRLHDAGIYTKRPSLAKNSTTCPFDKPESEERSVIDASSVVVTANAVPDPEQVYWVETPARWLGDADVTVKYTAQGTVSGAKAVATNPWSNFAVDLAGLAIKGALPLVGGSDSPKTTKNVTSGRCIVLSDGPAGGPKGAAATSTPCDEFHAELTELLEAAGTRGTTLSNHAGPDPQKLLTILDEDIETRRARFEGHVKKTTTARTLTWQPKAPPAVSAECAKEPESAGCSAAFTLTKGSLTVPTCPGTSNDPAQHVSPLHKLVISARITEAGMRMRNNFAAPLAASAAGFGSRARNDRGFPYRSPIATEVSTQLWVKTADTTFAGKGEPTHVTLPIAQFGSVGRLTPRAGGRKSTIDVVYFADTGALTSIQVTGEGSDSKPITDAILSRLPSEVDALKAEQAKVEAMAAICTSYAALAAPAPDYCNQ